MTVVDSSALDCAAYALAKTMDAPLLVKGNDFIHVDTKARV